MSHRVAYCIAGILVMAAALSMGAQEVLRPSRIQARSVRRQPSLGLPRRSDGQGDAVIWHDAGLWKGADSLRAVPFWNMTGIMEPAAMGPLAPVMDLAVAWAAERPAAPTAMVWGPYRGGWYAALCKRTRSDLGWKSIGFIIPPEGMDPSKGIFAYSHSVNNLEHVTGYNLFPKLPSNLQEIIEEMTANELLCPYQEFDPGLDESPDREIYDEIEQDTLE